jgi:hypothetical protein
MNNRNEFNDMIGYNQQFNRYMPQQRNDFMAMSDGSMRKPPYNNNNFQNQFYLNNNFNNFGAQNQIPSFLPQSMKGNLVIIKQQMFKETHYRLNKTRKTFVTITQNHPHKIVSQSTIMMRR